jgi:nicotinamidase-related amidase
MIPSAAPATDVHSRIVFDHLPKTGGTSVRMALAAALGDSGSVTETSCPHHVAIKGANGRRLLASHFWFFPGEPLAPGWLYATVLREPVERFLSQYFFYRAMSTAVLSGAVNDTRVVGAVHLDLDAYVDGPQELRLASSNVQALHYAWRHCDAPEHLAENDLIDAAIASLEGYDEVGVFPDLQPFLDNCCDRLDVARQRVAHLNATSGRLSRARVSPAVIATLVARNGADAALYKDLALPKAQLIIRKGYHQGTDSYSAFMEADGKTSTGLAAYLKAHGVDTVYVTGLATDFCVAWTAMDARKLGFNVYVIEDATRGIDLNGSLAAAWKQMTAKGVKRIQSADILG